jgi:DNA-binding Lrp family transcriptional regulator
MRQLKDLDFQIISELMKNAKISDREIAKKLGVSQPSVSRRRVRLEREKLIAYSVLPNFEAFGYDLLAFTFVHFDFDFSSGVFGDEAAELVSQAIQTHPNVIFASSGRGLGYEAVMLSVHKHFGGYQEFKNALRADLGKQARDIRSFAISMKGDNTFRPLSFAHLHDQLKNE